MSRTRLYSFVLAALLSLLALGAWVPMASAHSVALHEEASFDPGAPCSTDMPPTGIQMTTSLTGQIVQVPTTSISVDPCTLWTILQQGNAANVTVQADESIPAAFVFVFKQAVIAHARDLWNTDLPCPHPEDGVFFNVVTPTLWTSFTPIFYYDVFEELHPTVVCLQ